MTADEMFEELGYKGRYGAENLMVYEKEFEFKSKKEPISKTIAFDLERKEVSAFSYYKDIEYGIGIDITLDELKAINKKIEELGW